VRILAARAAGITADKPRVEPPERRGLTVSEPFAKDLQRRLAETGGMSQRIASATRPVALTAPAASAASPGPSLPVDRIFVVKLGMQTHGLRSACHGEVEHVLSGRRQAFASAEELLRALGLAG
jgi:hypothetical protein